MEASSGNGSKRNRNIEVKTRTGEEVLRATIRICPYSRLENYQESIGWGRFKRRKMRVVARRYSAGTQIRCKWSRPVKKKDNPIQLLCSEGLGEPNPRLIPSPKPLPLQAGVVFETWCA